MSSGDDHTPRDTVAQPRGRPLAPGAGAAILPAPARRRISPSPPAMPARPSCLDRLGLSRPELRAWAMYDWAVSAVQTTIMVAVFPIYFIRSRGGSAGERRRRSTSRPPTASPGRSSSCSRRCWARWRTTRRSGSGSSPASCWWGWSRRRRCSSSGGATWRSPTPSSSSRSSGAAGSQVFYESLLPHVARARTEIDRVSTAGYALGYLGGGLLLALNLAWILDPGLFGLPAGEGLTPGQATLPTRLALASVAVWWLLFSIPALPAVPEPPRRSRPTSRRRRTRCGRAGAARRDAAGAAGLPPGLPDAARLPHLQRGASRRSSRWPPPTARSWGSARDSLILRDPAGAVRRRPLRLPLRAAGRPHRRRGPPSTWGSASTR